MFQYLFFHDRCLVFTCEFPFYFSSFAERYIAGINLNLFKKECPPDPECGLVFGGFLVFWCEIKAFIHKRCELDHNRPYFQSMSTISQKKIPNIPYSVPNIQSYYSNSAWPNVINTKCESVVGIVTALTLSNYSSCIFRISFSLFAGIFADRKFVCWHCQCIAYSTYKYYTKCQWTLYDCYMVQPFVVLYSFIFCLFQMAHHQKKKEERRWIKVARTQDAIIMESIVDCCLCCWFSEFFFFWIE